MTSNDLLTINALLEGKPLDDVVLDPWELAQEILILDDADEMQLLEQHVAAARELFSAIGVRVEGILDAISAFEDLEARTSPFTLVCADRDREFGPIYWNSGVPACFATYLEASGQEIDYAKFGMQVLKSDFVRAAYGKSDLWIARIED